MSGPPGRGPSRRSVLLLLVAPATLAGCASIPETGPVAAGAELRDEPEAVFQLLAKPPSATADPRTLVGDFLEAGGRYDDDHAVARAYLVSSIRTTWRADTPVTVYPGRDTLEYAVTRGGVTVTYDGDTAITDSGTGEPTATASAQDPPRIGERATVTVQAPITARIDTDGQYTVAPDGDVEVRSFELVGTADGWRISDLDAGVMVTGFDFGVIFRGLPVYFVDPTGSYLVPEVRWLPVSGTATATLLVATLLRGPSTWLDDAVTSGAPVSTALTVNGVRVEDGLATVDLDTTARSAGPVDRQRLREQLAATLAALDQLSTSVTDIEITVDDQRYDVPSGTPSAAVADPSGGTAVLGRSAQVDARPVAVNTAGRLVRLSGRTAEVVDGLSGLRRAGARFPAVDLEGNRYAALDADLRRLLTQVPGAPVRTVLASGRDLVAPGFDPFGAVWTCAAENPGTVLCADPDGGHHVVEAPWLRGVTVRSLRISRDGARAVLAVTDTDGTEQALVSGVVRGEDGVPGWMATPARLVADAVEVRCAAWVDETRVVVAARRPASGDRPLLVRIGGEVEATVPALSAVTVTAGNTEYEVYAQGTDGVVRVRTGTTWTQVPDVASPAMPG